MIGFNAQIRDGFESLILLASFTSNEDLVKHIQQIQKDIRNNG